MSPRGTGCALVYVDREPGVQPVGIVAVLHRLRRTSLGRLREVCFSPSWFEVSLERVWRLFVRVVF